MSLPIDDVMPRVLAAIDERGAAVIVAPPGAGKTTRVPAAIVRAGLAGEGQVLVLEPRRVAARAAARFMARAHGSAVGDHVGYAVRFDRKVGRSTRIVVVTEGILTRRLQRDPFLEGVGAVVLDEFHERSLDADLALAMLREVRSDARPDLKLVVMSATIDPEPIARYLGDVPVVESAGRQHPVEVTWAEMRDDRPLVPRVVGGVRSMLGGSTGDLLVFLPGAGEIKRVGEALGSVAGECGFDVVPLHGDLSAEAQDRALARGERRRVVLATNVAETSVTIDGVDTVIDAGLVRVLRHDPGLGIDRLELVPVSRASADQRAGRAGRLGPGRALRLWTRARHRELEERAAPEIRRVDLASTVLELLAWGVEDATKFPWFEAPSAADVARAGELLRDLGAIAARGTALTALGRRLLRLPVHPRLGCLVLESDRRGCLDAGAFCAALSSERDPLRSARPFSDDPSPHPAGPSDLWLRWELAQEARDGSGAARRELDGRAMRRVERTARDLAQLVRRDRDADDGIPAEARSALGGPPPPHTHSVPGGGDTPPPTDPATALARAVLAAFPDRVARRIGDTDRAVMVGGRGLVLDPGCVVREARLFVAVALTAGRRGEHARSRVRLASAIEPAWLEEHFPDAVSTDDSVAFDLESERVVTSRRTLFRDLVLDERGGGRPDPAAVETVLADAVRAHPDAVMPRDHDVLQWVQRLRALAGWRPELALPDLDDAALIDAVCDLCPGRRSFDELRRASILPVLQGRLDHLQLRVLDREAPVALELCSGRSIRLRYEPGRPPVLSAQVQHLFGVIDTPTVAGGRVACLVELLAPNRRPVQVTQDLRSFWTNTYTQVRKDLRGRYPKHDWPECPPGL